MSDLAWTKAAALLKLNRADGWPDSLSIERLALLQVGRPDREAKAIADTLKDACKAGRLACSAQEVTPRPPPRVVYQPSPFASREWAARDFPRPTARPAPPQPVTVYTLRPEDFAGWLAQNKLPPAELVAAWFDATGPRAVAQPTAQAAPELPQPAADAREDTINRDIRWHLQYLLEYQKNPDLSLAAVARSIATAEGLKVETVRKGMRRGAEHHKGREREGEQEPQVDPRHGSVFHLADLTAKAARKKRPSGRG
jgi:hypothetical protein